MTLYKVLKANGHSTIRHWDGWPRPRGKQPGKWIRCEGPLVACENGLHLCREGDLVRWLGPVIYEAEARGDRLEVEDKIVVREARLICRLDTWNERSARHFACDCAEQALQYVPDAKARAICAESIAVARRYGDGEANEKELAAAWTAARAAAWAAARAAAWTAARAAAWTAARAAAWDAARDAASAAARDAAWDAARAAASAGASAGASVAARDAARDRQTARLMEYLRGERP